MQQRAIIYSAAPLGVGLETIYGAVLILIMKYPLSLINALPISLLIPTESCSLKLLKYITTILEKLFTLHLLVGAK
jgi:hypothetical protein